MDDKPAPKRIPVTCNDCGKPIEVAESTYNACRRNNRPFRCTQCRYKYFAERTKAYNDSRTPEQIQKQKETASKANKEKWERMDPEKRESMMSSMTAKAKEWKKNETEEERERISKIHTESNKRRWENYTDEEREQISIDTKTRWENRSDEYKREWGEDISKRWKNYTDEEYTIITTNMSNAKKEWWANLDQDKYAEISQNASKKSKQWWDNLSKEEKIEYGKYLGSFLVEWWSTASEEDLLKRSMKLSIAKKKWWENIPLDVKLAIIRKANISSSSIYNTLHTKFEQHFNNDLVSYFYFINEVPTSNNGVTHCWDYGIFDQNGELECLVDLDGAYYHGDNCDYDANHSKTQYDERRGLSIPDGVKWHIIYELKFNESFKYLLSILPLECDEFIDKRFKELSLIPFPYPNYSIAELYKSYDTLIRMNPNDKYHQDINMNTRLGDRIVYHFHPSIWRDVQGIWKHNLRQLIESHTIYHSYINHNKILQGLEHPTFMSGGKAKMIIDRYLSEYNEIFDPFVSYGGRMLGSISLNKRYIGYESDEVLIHENENILKFLKDHMIKYDVSLMYTDARSNTGVYECMFTECNENDINILMSIYQCKKYVFVVDNKIIIK